MASGKGSTSSSSRGRRPLYPKRSKLDAADNEVEVGRANILPRSASVQSQSSLVSGSTKPHKRASSEDSLAKSLPGASYDTARGKINRSASYVERGAARHTKPTLATTTVATSTSGAKTNRQNLVGSFVSTGVKVKTFRDAACDARPLVPRTTSKPKKPQDRLKEAKGCKFKPHVPKIRSADVSKEPQFAAKDVKFSSRAEVQRDRSETPTVTVSESAPSSPKKQARDDDIKHSSPTHRAHSFIKRIINSPKLSRARSRSQEHHLDPQGAATKHPLSPGSKEGGGGAARNISASVECLRRSFSLRSTKSSSSNSGAESPSTEKKEKPITPKTKRFKSPLRIHFLTKSPEKLKRSPDKSYTSACCPHSPTAIVVPKLVPRSPCRADVVSLADLIHGGGGGGGHLSPELPHTSLYERLGHTGAAYTVAEAGEEGTEAESNLQQCVSILGKNARTLVTEADSIGAQKSANRLESGGENMEEQNSVRQWLNSITDTTEVDGEAMDSTGSATTPAASVTAASVITSSQPSGHVEEDDLFLGAEAKTINGLNPAPAASSQNNGGPGSKSPHNASLQQRLTRLQHTDSLDSKDSHRTYESVEQILQERSGNPEEILTFLGFGGSEDDGGSAGRIPERFLRHKSNAYGISPEKFMDNNPDIRDYLQMQMSASYVIPGTMGSSADANDGGGEVKDKRTLASTARHMMLLQRLAGTTSRRLWAKPNVVEISHRTAPQELKAKDGQSYSTILHPDNGEHLAEQGLYKTFTHPENVKRWDLVASVIKGPPSPKKQKDGDSVAASALPKTPVSPCPTLTASSPNTLHPLANTLVPGSPGPSTSPFNFASPVRSRSGSMNGSPVPERFVFNPSICDDNNNPPPVTPEIAPANVELIIPVHLRKELSRMHPDAPVETSSGGTTNDTSSQDRTGSKSCQDISITEMWDNADLPGVTRASQTSTTTTDSQPPVTVTSTEFEQELEKKLEVLEKQLQRTDTFSHESDQSSSVFSNPKMKSLRLEDKSQQSLLSTSSSAGVDSFPSESSIAEGKLEALDQGQSDRFSNSSSDQASSCQSIKELNNNMTVVEEREEGSAGKFLQVPPRTKPPRLESRQTCSDAQSQWQKSQEGEDRPRLKDSSVQQSFELEEVLSSDMLLHDDPTPLSAAAARGNLSRTDSTQSDSSGFVEADSVPSRKRAIDVSKVKKVGTSNDSEAVVVTANGGSLASKPPSKPAPKAAKQPTKQPEKKVTKPPEKKVTKSPEKQVTKTTTKQAEKSKSVKESKPQPKITKPEKVVEKKTETKVSSKPEPKSTQPSKTKEPVKVEEVIEEIAAKYQPVSGPVEEVVITKTEQIVEKTPLTVMIPEASVSLPRSPMSPTRKGSGIHEMHIKLTVPRKNKKQDILDGIQRPTSSKEKTMFIKEDMNSDEEFEMYENVTKQYSELRISSPIAQQSPVHEWKVSEVDASRQDVNGGRGREKGLVSYSTEIASPVKSPKEQEPIYTTAIPTEPKVKLQRCVSEMYLVVGGSGTIKEIDSRSLSDSTKPKDQYEEDLDQKLESVQGLQSFGSLDSCSSETTMPKYSKLDSGVFMEANGREAHNGNEEDADEIPTRRLSRTKKPSPVVIQKGRFPWNYDQVALPAGDADGLEASGGVGNHNNNNISPVEEMRGSRSSSFLSVASDVSEHQMLQALLKQSHYIKSDSEELLSRAEWPLFAQTRATSRQHLVEEVKLMQHALHKYKLEFRSLEIRARAQYRSQLDALGYEEREAWESLCDLKSEVGKEINEMERLLNMRMKSIIAGKEVHYDPTDLASMHVINQMIELLKEQVYHGNIVNSLDIVTGNAAPHPMLVELETAYDEHDDAMGTRGAGMTLMDQLALLQRQIESQQSQTTSVLNTSMRDLRQVLLEEIRHSIHSETQDLRHQVLAAEAELKTLKRQMSAPSELGKLMAAASFDIDVDIPESPNEM